MPNDIRLPGLTHRTAIIGRTGSGKTRFGTWILSISPFDKQPYVIIDHKREGLFERIDHIKEIGYNEIPKQPGLYLLQPDLRFDDHEDALDAWLLRALDREKVGLYIDEGASIAPRSRAFRAVLSQGRSKHVPVITLTQRPREVSRSIFSEADFFSFFQLSIEDDRKTAQSYAPKSRINLDEKLPDFHSYWYDVVRDAVFKMGPVPSDNEILDMIDFRLAPKRKVV